MKLEILKGALLFVMGTVHLVKSIIHGMLVYSFHIYRWLIKLLLLLDIWITNFIWSCDIHSEKIYNLAWSHICCPWESRGLDLKSTRYICWSRWAMAHPKFFSWLRHCQPIYFYESWLLSLTSFQIATNLSFDSNIWPPLLTNDQSIINVV